MLAGLLFESHQRDLSISDPLCGESIKLLDFELTLVMLNDFRELKDVFISFIITQYWDGAGSSNPSLRTTRICLFYKVSIMVTDDLATQGARASAVMIFVSFSWTILASASGGWSTQAAPTWCIMDVIYWTPESYHPLWSTEPISC